MSAATVLAAVSAIAALAAARELLADHGERWSGWLRARARRLPPGIASSDGAAAALGVARRLRRAGLDESVTPRTVLAAKACTAAMGAGAWMAAAGSMPARAGVALLVVCMLAGFLAPDVMLERAGRRRAWALRAELADGLDLIALETAAGVSVPRGISMAAARGSGPLAQELGRAAAALEAGQPPGAVLRALGADAGIGELALAGRALERSLRLGAPVAEELAAQAASIRRERARAVREAADRAGPKIQLVVALILVPAVLLVIAAALLAHAGSLLGGL